MPTPSAPVRPPAPAPSEATGESLLVPLHDRILHLRQDGAGPVAIVLDGDDGAGTSTFEPLVSALAAEARLVRYDRAGYGRSDPAPGPPTADERAQDLRRALARAGIEGPFLLVGGGLGGTVLRAFAHRYRGDVVGLVLVDVPPVGFAARAPASWRRRAGRARAALTLRAFLERLRPGSGRPSAARRDELAAVEESDREATAFPPLVDLPLVVVARARPDPLAGLPARDRARAEALWARLQRETAGASTRGRHLPIEDASGDPLVERPELVAGIVRELLAASARDA